VISQLHTSFGTAGNQSLLITPDSDFLSDPAMTYPVTVDHGVLLDYGINTYVDSAFPTTNYGSSGELRVGNYGSGTTRSYAASATVPSTARRCPPAVTGMDKLLLTPLEAARTLGIGRSKLYELLASGNLASVHIGSCRRVPLEALRDYVAQFQESSALHS
jgi:excisionase family DNA binding protein